MQEHIRFILHHAAIGAVIAFAFVGMLLGLNLVDLRHLVLNSADGGLAVVMLYIFCTITFGSAPIGYRIITLSDDDQGVRAAVIGPLPRRCNQFLFASERTSWAEVKAEVTEPHPP